MKSLKKIFIKFASSDHRKKLLKLLPKNSLGCEVGVWKGDFSSQILKIVAPRKLYLIDPWKYYPEYKSAWFGGRAKSQSFMDEVYNLVRTKFEKYINNKTIIIIRKTSLEGAEDLENDHFDWIYIDGNHTYEYVKEDLMNFSKKVKVGGFLCGDDYGAGGWWQGGVKKAVDEFVNNSHNFELKYILGGQFVLLKIKDSIDLH